MIFPVLGLFMSCQSPHPIADAMIVNGQLWTGESTVKDTNITALAIKNGKIMLVGSDAAVLKLKGASTEVINAKGNFVMPGWIEGHGHFSSLGYSLINLNLLHAKNWEAIIDSVGVRAKSLPKGTWIEGRGWHQEKWDREVHPSFHGYPKHDDLSAVSPDHPVILYHASGHALFANKRAMDICGVSRETPDPSGGAIVRDGNGDPIGVFEERAMDIIHSGYRAYLAGLDKKTQEKKWYHAIDLAQKECLSKGITSFQDAGSKFFELDRYRKMAQHGDLDIRLWAMVRHSADEMRGKLDDYKVIGAGNGFFTCNAIKSEIDGALGSFGAWLLKPYTDNPDFSGQNTTPLKEVEAIAQLALDQEMQMCVHAIGDRANREVLDLYERMLSTVPDGKSRRWRIEHAQHLDPSDIPRFAKNGIIAAMQGLHCTSDAPFVVSRLGEERARKGAYAWRSLLSQGAIIANGTDAPVEDVDPIYSFYASVTRRRTSSPQMVFFPEQKMTREEALKSYTLWNAYAAFEDDGKGSLSAGKYADIVIMSKNLLHCPDEEILDAKVLMTMVNGEVKYRGEF